VNKAEIRDRLVEKLQAEADVIALAAKAAHAAATHEESRAEDQHDTRGIEASYLAGAQAQRAADLQALVSTYRMMPVGVFGSGDGIGPGAFVELELSESGRKSCYFIVHRGGGVSVQVGGVTILVIAPQSPLGEALIGRRVGDEIEVEAQGGVREYRVVSVQ
jgi:transcription elongation GreA/GreB family factor